MKLSDKYRDYLAADALHQKTAALVAIAEALVDLRAEIGDLRGASYAYRQTVGEAMGDAGIPVSDRAGIQAAVRYHVSNVLRERYPAEVLADADMMPANARQRSNAARRKVYAELAAYRQLGAALKVIGGAS